MIPREQLKFIKAYNKPLNKLVAGTGYKRKGEYYIRMGDGFMGWLDICLEKKDFHTAVVKELTQRIRRKEKEDWPEPDCIKTGLEYLEIVVDR